MWSATYREEVVIRRSVQLRSSAWALISVCVCLPPIFGVFVHPENQLLVSPWTPTGNLASSSTNMHADGMVVE